MEQKQNSNVLPYMKTETDLIETLADLTAQDDPATRTLCYGHFWERVCQYHLSGGQTELQPLPPEFAGLKVLLIMATRSLDKKREAVEALRNIRAEVGRKGGQAKARNRKKRQSDEDEAAE